MREKIGDWLLDVSKYVVTAVLLTTLFADVEQKWVVYVGGVIAAVVPFGWGYFLLKGTKK